MPFVTRFSNDCLFVPGAVLRWTSVEPPYRSLYHLDGVLRLGRRPFLVFPPVRSSRAFGFHKSSDITIHRDLGYRRSDDYRGDSDWARYGSTLACLRALMSGGVFSNENENQIYHASTVGDVVVGRPTPAYHDGGDVVQMDAHARRVVYQTPGVLRYDPSRDTPYYCLGSGFSSSPDSKYLFFEGKLFGSYEKGGSFACMEEFYAPTTNRIVVSDIDWSMGEDFVKLSYKVTWFILGDTWAYGCHITPGIIAWNVDFTISYVFSDAEGSHSAPLTGYVDKACDSIATVHEIYHATVRERAMSDDDLWMAGDPNPGFYQVGVSFTYDTTGPASFCVAATPWSSSDIESSTGRSYSGFAGPRRAIEDVFRDWINQNMSDIRPASALSTAAAMNDLESSANTDVLQTLVKIVDISSQVPNLVEGINILRRLKGHDFSCIPEILDFVSKLRLQQSFQWRPEFDLLLKYLPQIPGILSSLSVTKPTVIGRGKYEYRFLPTECPRDTKLVVRSKIVASSHLQRDLVSYLRLDALGITPSAANLWDLIPYSFVVNWFTNMGARMRVVGQLANLWLLDVVVLVHTFTLTSDLTDEEMNKCELANSLPGLNPHLRVFVREVSAYIPLYSASRFDFERPTRAPDWSIVASLLWQWMR